MALSLGSALATRVYLGATEINLAYFGATQVYTSSAFSAEAQNYFDRLDTAGDTTYVDYKQPLANYIDSLVTLGGAYWDDMGSAASFVGVGIQGVTVPLKSTMTALTNNNFVAGDLDQSTGLKGDGSTKYLDTGSKFNDFPQNDFSMSANITEFIQETTNGNYLTYQSFGDGISQIATQNDQGVNPNNLITRCNTRNGENNFDIGNLEDFYGINRTVSTEYSVQYGASSKTVTESSQAPANQIISIFGASTEVKSNARMATYHIGPALNLATLRGLQETLLSEVAAAKGAAAAANYFARLDTAGDTTYVPYKQPLTNYISSLVALGGAYWDDMKSAASFVGVGIQGITVPLRDGMPTLTNNSFVAGDLNQLTGLKGDASTKYIGTGLTGSDLSLNDHSLSVYLTADRETGGNRYISGDASTFTVLGNTTGFRARSANTTLSTLGSSTATGELIGISRNNSADYDWSYETTGTQSSTSSSINNVDINVYADSGGSNNTAARLATYHAGPALNLATLEGLQATLLSEIRTAHTFVAAESYFSRLAAAGDTTHVAYKQPLTNYITSLVELGGAYWDDMLSATSFVGVGIQGVAVPLRDGMTVPTNNNFVAGDLNTLTGLKGDGSTKYIATNVAGTALLQDDASASVHITTAATGANKFYMTNAGGASLSLRSTPQQSLNSSSVATLGIVPTSGVYGASRSSSTTIDARSNQTSYSAAITSIAPSANDLYVYSIGTTPSADARLATYHAGPALDLATLEGLQDTLLAEIAGIGFSTEAANYFSRLAIAGDTTFLAYRQPLANYIDSLVALGGAYWDDMLSAASFVGVGIQGITVPLRDGMTVPTQNNFVAGDLNTLTGLLCNGSTKRISTNTDQSNYAQNDTSVSTYRTETVSGTNPFYFGTNLANGFGARGSFITACYGSQAVTGSASTTVGLLGLSRSASTGYDYRSNGTTGTRTTASVTPASGNLDIFAINGTTSGSFRLATYHAGPALNLATLEGLQDTLITEIAAI